MRRGRAPAERPARAKHRSELEARRHALFRRDARRIEVSVMDEGVEGPDARDDDLPGTAREALEVALAAEKRAYRFSEEAIPHLNDAQVRSFFQELRDEERERQALLEKKIRALAAGAPAGAPGASAR